KTVLPNTNGGSPIPYEDLTAAASSFGLCR
ncbi:MAG: hypothetical protein ACI9OI_000649, partial [Chitinophagales bacterium]